MPFQVAPIARHASFAGGMGALIGAHPRVFPAPFNYIGRYTEYYCTSVGSNLNSGTDENAVAKYTSTNGNWSTVTLQFIPTDSSIPIGTVFPGDTVSIYIDGATVGVYLARVVSVADGVNGAITVVALTGTPPTTSATARSIKVGGAWKGPNGAVTFPMNLTVESLQNSYGDPVRVNLKNDQIYSMTAGITPAGNQCQYWGYSVRPGDGGRAVFDAGGNNFTLLSCGQNQFYVDLEFRNNVTGVATTLVNAQGTVYLRCVFHDSGGSAVFMTTNPPWFYECEFYRGNLSNAGTNMGCVGASTAGYFYRCYFHDAYNGSNSKLVVDSQGSVFTECIFADCQFDAIAQTNDSTAFLTRTVFACTFWNIGRACIQMENTGGNTIRRQICYNNIVVNCGMFISPASSGAQSHYGAIFNTAYYNVAKLINPTPFGRFITEYNSIPLSGNPFVNAPAGDFRLVNVEVVSKGRGQFTETFAGRSGTVSYPDIGSVQRQDASSLAVTQNYLPDGYVGNNYAESQVFTSDIVASLSSGTPPPGLNLTQPDTKTFLISGVPSTVGTYSFALQVVGGNINSVLPFVVKINAGLAPVGGATGGVSGG